MSFSGKVAIVAGVGAKVAPSDLKERPGDIASGLGAGVRLFPLSDKAGSITGKFADRLKCLDIAGESSLSAARSPGCAVDTHHREPSLSTPTIIRAL